MKLHTATTWDEMFLRVLQSWADSARDVAPLRPKQDRCYSACGCTRDDLVAYAMRHDETVATWPHWMQSQLSFLLWELKLEIQERTARRPHYDSTVAGYYLGSGSIRSDRRSEPVQEAMEIVDLNTKLFHLWMHDRLANLGYWPRRVYARLRIGDWLF